MISFAFMMRILILEDDFTLSKEVKQFFSSKDIQCDTVFDGNLFMKQAQQHSYDVYILDINVPGINGLEVCKQIRKTDKNTSVLMLTAFSDVQDKVDAFELGADDYLVKPFHFEELFVRVMALWRRKSTPQQQTETFTCANLTIDVNQAVVHRDDVKIELTPKEFKLLLLLAEANGRIISKQNIAEKLWDYHIETSQNTIEVYINFLRKKIDRDFHPKLIHTKPGYGYYLKAED